MKKRIAINGFGRVGRLVFRQMLEQDGYEMVAINDLAPPDMLAYLLKFDSAQETFRHADAVSHDENTLEVAGKSVAVFREQDASKLPWGDLGIDLVMECSGAYTSSQKSQAHINVGAGRVIISSSAGTDIPTIVFGVNEQVLKAKDVIISAASCSTNCLAPMVKALNDYAPVLSGYMNTIHGYTATQKIVDSVHPKGNFRRARAAAVNIVPTVAQAAEAVGLVLPKLRGKLFGCAHRVPVPAGCCIVFTAVVQRKDVTVEAVNAAFLTATNEVLGYTEEFVVSSDIIGITYGALFDATQTKASKINDELHQVQIVSWFDNENSYASQMVRTAEYLLSLS
ncbi:MAG: type I glyceraldehyde-3-phosphate dehydrogenase [Desulfovibrio sp.]|jgi:glyceraldehyde 3-phosphate dehydrogenase|nr:type I glyceraldehyde-3-phosphate dehydrogenase [Desulfovibrio sp.]